jgi:hypothetical protein
VFLETLKAMVSPVPKKLFIISDSPAIRSAFSPVAADLPEVETIPLDSVSAVQLLAHSSISLTETIETAVESLKSTAPRSFTIRMTRQNGSRFWAGCLAVPFCSPEGNGVTLFFSDVT